MAAQIKMVWLESGSTGTRTQSFGEAKEIDITQVANATALDSALRKVATLSDASFRDALYVRTYSTTEIINA